MTELTLAQKDKRYTWHPFTQEHTADAPLPVVGAKGAYLELSGGHKVLDAISSWWTNIHGHGHPKLAKAIGEQVSLLDHVLFAGCTHDGAAEVAKRLVEITPDGLNRVFYSDNGSTAVEVALKMAFQYWQNQGDNKRKRFLAFEGAYHGDTVGAMSAGDPGEFGEPFRPLFFPVERLSAPRIEGGNEEYEAAVKHLDRILDSHGDELAAVIIEPMVQGAGGMRMHGAKFLKTLADRVQERGILLITDEVMTGFGRTGKMFAAQHAGINPDIMCVAKGLTGGILPLSATLATDAIYDAFLDNDVRRAFLHGHSFTANPIACAAALASLQIFEDEPVFERIQSIEAVYRERFGAIEKRAMVKSTRILGSIGVVELSGDGGYFNNIGLRLRRAFYEAGFLSVHSAPWSTHCHLTSPIRRIFIDFTIISSTCSKKAYKLRICQPACFTHTKTVNHCALLKIGMKNIVNWY